MIKDVEYISYTYLPSLVRCLFKIAHFLACLIILVRTSSTLITRSGKMGHSHLIQDLREKKIHFLSSKYAVSSRYFVEVVYQFEEFPFYF